MLHQTSICMLCKVSAGGTMSDITWEMFELRIIIKLQQVLEEIIVSPITQFILELQSVPCLLFNHPFEKSS